MVPSLTGGLLMMTNMLSSLPPSERKLAEYLLENPQDAIHCTAHELGDRSKTSSAAVIRLCKSLGLKGFQELKIRIAGDLHRPMEERYRDIEPQETQSSVLSKMTANSIQAIRETAEIVNMEELDRAVKALSNAKTIYFFGVGASAIIALDAQQKFLRIHKQAIAFSDIHMTAMLMANVSKDDVVVGISYSGETKEIIEIMDLANDRDATTISL
ncbi:MAG: MurR/RpiR family transcriptional regulator, partial [Bacilli bacterium]